MIGEWMLSAALALGVGAAKVHPEDGDDVKDHPAVKRFPGSWLANSVERDFETFNFPNTTGEKESAGTPVEGKYYAGLYYFPEKASCTEILRNYENALKAAGLKTTRGSFVPEQPGSLALENPAYDHVRAEGVMKGAQVWVLQSCNSDPGYHAGALVVVEGKGMDQKVEITADFLADEIERTGRVALYGINFATGKADITPDSAKILETIGQLLTNKADWKLRVEGHTDNVGKSKANQELSKKRAAAVKAWLVEKHKVAKDRLTSDGFGDAKPIAPNDTDANKAKNRRVELVKI